MPQAIRKLALFTALVCAAALCLPTLLAQNGIDHRTRDISGTVTDPHHEPLRGAIVQLQPDGSSNVTTYVTGDDGRYRFLRLDGNQDYRVWVKFRNRSSRAKSISKFDSNMNKTLDFSVESF